MKAECLNYILDMIINDFTSNANQDQIEKYKKLYPNEIKWELGIEKAIKEYAKNKTRTEYIIEEIYKFMKQENLLGDFDHNPTNQDNNQNHNQDNNQNNNPTNQDNNQNHNPTNQDNNQNHNPTNQDNNQNNNPTN